MRCERRLKLGTSPVFQAWHRPLIGPYITRGRVTPNIVHKNDSFRSFVVFGVRNQATKDGLETNNVTYIIRNIFLKNM